MPRVVNRGSKLTLLAGLICFLSISLTFSSSTFGFGSTNRSQIANFKAGTINTSAEQDFLNRTNALRASLGLGTLRTNSELLTKARSWSQTQAASGTIFHSTLTNGVTQNWYRLGENVGMGPEVVAIHDALVRSPRHYENLVDPGFTDVGIGVIQEGNTIYVTQVFMQLMPSQATQATTPAKPKAAAPKVSGSTSSNPSQAPAPVAQAAPLKTASEELIEIVEKISVLESSNP